MSTSRDVGGKGAASRMLSDERSFWQFATGLFCGFAVLKGIFAPNSWVYTQALLDYSHGLIKRGLRGEVFLLLHITTLPALTVAFFVELAALLLLLGELTRRTGVQQRFGSLAPVAVFASSYALTYLTTLVGYTDIPLAACTVLLLLVREARRRFLYALVLVPLALLVHENYLLMSLPPLLFSFVVDAFAARTAKRRHQELLMALLLGAAAVAVTLLIARRPSLPPAEALRFEAELHARAHFDLHPEIFHVLSRPLGDSMRQAWEGLHEAQWLVPGLTSLANLLPPVIFLLYLCRRLIRQDLQAQNDRAASLLWAATLTAVLMPLLMYALGFDFGRWNTASALCAYLCFLVLARSAPDAQMQLSAAERNVVVLLLAFNMATGFGLFGDSMTHPFPFLPALSDSLR